MQDAISPLLAWDNFYVIIGSSSAALTGLQFVVIALISESRLPRGTREIAAFGTPTIVHFCAVLLVSTILAAPWHALSNVGFALSGCGVAGAAYVVLIFWRARRQTGYKPVFEDWLWHVILPLIAYSGVALSGIAMQRNPDRFLFVIGGMSILLLFIGIHNAWDTVVYVVVDYNEKNPAK
jgi:hypothetical protein